jgi:hypothetical protein
MLPNFWLIKYFIQGFSKVMSSRRNSFNKKRLHICKQSGFDKALVEKFN